MSSHGNDAQPNPKPPMSINPEAQNFAKTAGTEYVKGLAKEGGKQTAQYESDNGQEQLDAAQKEIDDAKAHAQGMWAKYCGCFSGA